MPPPTLHRVARFLVAGIAGLLRLLEVTVLGFDDVVR